MSKEETKEAVVEETKAEETKTEEVATETTEEEMSPWYYFFSQGCGFCKKSEPIVDQLNESGKYPEILKLDMAEPDNQVLQTLLQQDPHQLMLQKPFVVQEINPEASLY